MSQENVEVVRRCNRLWAEHDFSQMPEIFDPEVVIDMSDAVFNPDVYEGYDGVKRLLATVHEMWDRFKVETEEVIDAGESVFVVVRLYGVGRGSGVEVEMAFFQVWTMRDGRVLHMKGDYRDRKEALKAAGLKE